MVLTKPKEFEWPRRIAVAFSGGVDSSVLLHWFAGAREEFGFSLSAVHVDHGLHADSGDWASHANGVARALDVSLSILKADPSQIRAGAQSLGLEGAARNARYGLILPYLRALGDETVLALGHHQDDQAETFLLRALRASSTHGLGAMRPWSTRDGIQLWRPLLDVPKAEILAYAAAHQLPYVNDPSNSRSDQDRDFLRNQVMPLLQLRWPHVAASFARSAALAASDAAALVHLDSQALDTAKHRETTNDEEVLCVSTLGQHSQSDIARMLRLWLQQMEFPPVPGHLLDGFLADLDNPHAKLEWRGHQLRQWQAQLYAVRPHLALDPLWKLTIERDENQPKTIVLPNQSSLVISGQLTKPLFASIRSGGERVTLANRAHSSSVKKLLNATTPPWLRDVIPVIRDAAGEVLCVGNAIRTASYARWQSETGGQIVWQPKLALN